MLNWARRRPCLFLFVILRSALFADRRTYGLVGSRSVTDKLHRSFVAENRLLRMTGFGIPSGRAGGCPRDFALRQRPSTEWCCFLFSFYPGLTPWAIVCRPFGAGFWRGHFVFVPTLSLQKAQDKGGATGRPSTRPTAVAGQCLMRNRIRWVLGSRGCRPR